MNNYKLTIQYDGGRYKGWQRLGNSDDTIQGKIENVLTEMAGEKSRSSDAAERMPVFMPLLKSPILRSVKI